MSNSPLVDYVRISPNRNSPRADKIKKIAIHHTAGVLSVETIGNIFSGGSRSASSNYGIGSDGSVGMYVEEKDRSWCTSSGWVDNQAITIECSNSSTGGDWPVSDLVLNKLVLLCVDICKRNGLTEVSFTGDQNGTLVMHKWFAATACPGPYLSGKFAWIASEINKRLKGEDKKVLYRVQVGAYAIKGNADKTASELKAAGFNTYMVKVDGLYKVQTGAFAVKANADSLASQLRQLGFSTYITTEAGTPVSIGAVEPVTEALKAGDKVRVNVGAKTYEGLTLADFVYRSVYTVLELNKDRAVIGIDGRVTAAVDTKDLVKV